MSLDIHAAALGDWVSDFVRGSNRISGILREPTAAELAAHRGLLAAGSLRVENLELFTHHVAPGAVLRGSPGVDAASCDEMPAADIRADLDTILLAAQTRSASPQRLHRIYKMLRPFTDGNGRGARAVWMWQVMRGTREELSELMRAWPAGSPVSGEFRHSAQR